MLSLALTAVALGGLANLVLALLNFVGLRHVTDPSKPLPRPSAFGRTSLRLEATRNIYLYLLYAALSFVYPTALVTTALGRGVLSGIFGYLLIQTFVFTMVPEIRLKNWWVLPCATGTGAACYACSIYGALNI
jgi:hypothetical protein